MFLLLILRLFYLMKKIYIEFILENFWELTLHSFSKMREKWPQRVINQNDKKLPQNFSQINLSRNQDWFFETIDCEFFSHVKISHDVMVQ